MSSERAAMSTLATGFKQVSVADQNAAKKLNYFVLQPCQIVMKVFQESKKAFHY